MPATSQNIANFPNATLTIHDKNIAVETVRVDRGSGKDGVRYVVRCFVDTRSIASEEVDKIILVEGKNNHVLSQCKIEKDGDDQLTISAFYYR